MITVTVCVGSSCHLKGAREVILRFNEALARHSLEQQVALKGSFCMERCGEGVNWKIDEETFSSADCDQAMAIFRERVLQPLGIEPSERSDRTMQS